jgi:hypothetical protein
MLGLGFRAGAGGKARTPRPPFSPAALFANGELGMWLDPSDLPTMFQDANGTIPAEIGLPVGRINDKSGRNWDVTQGSASARPVLQQDPAGRPYLEFDGVNDRLMTLTVPLGSGWDRVSAVRQTGWTSGRRIFSGAGTAGILQQTSASPGLALFDGSLGPANNGAALGAAAVLFERHAGASSLLAVNGGAAAAGNSGGNSAASVCIGADTGGGNAAAFHLYGLCLVKATLGEGVSAGGGQRRGRACGAAAAQRRRILRAVHRQGAAGAGVRRDGCGERGMAAASARAGAGDYPGGGAALRRAGGGAPGRGLCHRHRCAGEGWIRVTAAGEATRVRVTYRAGLAAEWSAAPEALRLGIVRLAAHFYTHRDAAEGGAPPRR